MLYRLPIVLLLTSVLVAQATQAPSAPSTQSGQTPAAMQARASRERDPLLDLPPLPETSVTLVGGTIIRLDRVRDRLIVRPFGGHDMEIAFDQRTKMLRDQTPIPARELVPGSRVYVDTLFDGSRIFAKNIQIRAQTNCQDVHGQVIDYDSRRGTLDITETVAPAPVKLRVSAQTQVQISGRSGTIAEVPSNALIIASFAPGSDGAPTACEIHVLAVPGQSFTFAGTITFVDLHTHRVAIANRSDATTYDLDVDHLSPDQIRGVREGQEATIETVFDGQGYQAKTIHMAAPSTQTQLK